MAEGITAQIDYHGMRWGGRIPLLCTSGVAVTTGSVHGRLDVYQAVLVGTGIGCACATQHLPNQRRIQVLLGLSPSSFGIFGIKVRT